MGQDRTTLTSHLSALKNEALMLLRFYIAFKRISQLKDLQEIDRTTFVDRLIGLKALENDLLIRICKLDDQKKGVHSFSNVLNEVSSSHPNFLKIHANIDKFSTVIRELKQNRRHKQLAHLAIGVLDNDYQVKIDFLPVIKLIVFIIDLINNEQVNYMWSDGQQEKYDLREKFK